MLDGERYWTGMKSFRPDSQILQKSLAVKMQTFFKITSLREQEKANTHSILDYNPLRKGERTNHIYTFIARYSFIQLSEQGNVD